MTMKELKLTTVDTPKTLKFLDQDRRTLHDIGSILTLEMDCYGKWTTQCTELMITNPRLLFLYDRLEYVMGNAYGSHGIKLALNPMKVMCPHPTCLTGKPVISLSHPFNLSTFLVHLRRHQDAMGDTLRKRFDTIHQNLFMSPSSLDTISIAPYHLQTIKMGNPLTLELMESFGIDRQLKSNYICHWKNVLIASKIINCESLSFQEDEALVESILSYPNPVKDWSLWNTLYLYGLKFMTSISSAALNLYRGITNYPGLNTHSSEVDIFKFASNINHPTASVTQFQDDLPNIDYRNKVFQGGHIIYHIKLLQKSEKTIFLCYSGSELIDVDDDFDVLRYPITVGCDEQELNPGTFLNEDNDGYLHGLEEKMSADDIRQLGINNLATHIASNNKMVKGVREYRATDFRNIFCSNVLTEFVSHELTGEECTERLKEGIKFANSCYKCLMEHVECKYEKIDEKCTYCAENRFRCISLIVLHVLWDMGSGHKKADSDWYHLSEDSPEAEMLSTQMVTIGFGGLHLCKAFVCASRNHVLNFNGEDFGVNILMELKQHCKILQGINNSVFVGRDRQADLLNAKLVDETVQHSLRLNKKYLITRVPEKYLSYKENAKTQVRIIIPTAVCTNLNGDVFLLDTGASCILVVDRSTVAKVFIVGTHNQSALSPYPQSFQNFARNIRLSSNLLDMQIHKNDVAVHDAGREEVLIIKECVTAKTVLSKNFFIFRAAGVISIMFDGFLYFLRFDDDNQKIIQKIRLNIPSAASNKQTVYLEEKLAGTLVLNIPVNTVSLFRVPRPGMIGIYDEHRLSHVLSIESKQVKEMMSLNVASDIKPYISADDKILFWSQNKLSIYKFSIQKESSSVVLTLIDKLDLDGHLKAFTIHGKVVSIAATLNTSRCTNEYAILQWGRLDFGLLYCEAVSKLYEAVNYVPPGGNSRFISLKECILIAQDCCSLLQKMQQEKENMYVSRHSFMGCDGIPWSQTINSFVRTYNSWKVLCARMEILKPGSSQDLSAHAAANESYIEHSFGFIKLTGQGHNQSQQEYVGSKRRHEIDFQMRMSKLPFCQYTKTKIRDKGYQSLESRQVQISLKEFKEIFNYSRSEKLVRKDSVNEVDKQLLKKATLLARYVPRQSSRNRWRASSGQIPTMIEDKSCGHLYLGDLVFCRRPDGGIKMLVVQKEVLLNNKALQVRVLSIAENTEVDILVENLVYHKQQILAISSAFYKISDGIPSFIDEFNPVFETIWNDIVDGESHYSDNEWSVLLEGEVLNEVDGNKNCTVENENFEENIEENSQINQLKRKNLKRKVSLSIPSDEEEGEEEKEKAIDEEEKLEICTRMKLKQERGQEAKVGDYVVVKYAYDKTVHIGIVKEVDVDLGYKVHTMLCGKGNSFTWTENDCIWYEHIITHVEMPVPCNNRGAYTLLDKDYKKFKSIL